MPLVVPSVNPEGLPGPRQSAALTPGLAGANAELPKDSIGPGLQSLADGMTALAVKAQREQDADEVLRADALATQKLNEYTADVGSRKGPAAWGVAKTAPADIDAIAVTAREGLTSDTARRSFDATWRKRAVTALDGINRHEIAQRDASLIDSSRAAAVTAIDFGTANYATPGAITDATTRITQATTLEGQKAGWTPERLDVELKDRVSKMHNNVLRTMLDTGQSAAATEYFAANRDKMTAQDTLQVQSALKVSTAITQAQDYADDADARGLTQDEARAEARKKFSGETEVRAIAEIDARWGQKRAAREGAQRDAADAAWKIAVKAGSVNAIPPSLVTQMDGKDLFNMQTALENRAYTLEQRSALRESRADRADAKAESAALKKRGNEQYTALYSEAVNNPDKFAKRNIELDGVDMTPSQQTQLMKLQGTLTGATDGGKALLAAKDSAIKTALRELKIKPTEADKAAPFTEAATNAFDQFEAEHGRPPRSEEARKITDGLLLQGTVPGNWFGTNDRRKFEADREGKGGQFTVKVPDLDRQQITEALKAQGNPKPSDADILNLYKRVKGIK